MSTLPFKFIDEGSEHPLTVLFLHAFPYHSGMWDGQRAALRGKARFLAFDARGLGENRARQGAYMLEHTVDDVLALLDHVAVERAVLCGVSMGGYVALRTVQRAPERVSGLVLADTQAAADGDAAKLARAEGVRALWREGRDAFADGQLKRQLSPLTWDRAPSLPDRLRAIIAGSPVEGIAASLVSIATRTDLSAALPDIRVPTRVLVGADDVITPPAAARAMAEAIPGADLHVLEGAGHLSNLEAEDDFNRLLLEHLSRIH